MMIESNPNYRDKFINVDLPYRLNVLMSHDIIIHSKSQKILINEKLILDATFEVSLLFGRLLMQFIEITFDKKEENTFKAYENKMMITTFLI